MSHKSKEGGIMSICTAPVYKMKELNNLFIEMTSKNCNQRCSGCYIEFPYKKEVKDFISIDTIKQALNDTKNENIFCIYFTGAEPMTHPDFNSILRLCLKRCNVCICTNGSFLNEKKVRFLNKVESEGTNQIFFKLSIAHYDEILSDKVKYRGNFRQNLSALKTLSRYNFTSVLSVQNFYNLDKQEVFDNVKLIFKENAITGVDVQVTASYPSNDIEIPSDLQNLNTDCMHGRVLSGNGVYSCPFLANDYRGRVGSSFNDYSKNVSAETNFCSTCASNRDKIFAIG